MEQKELGIILAGDSLGVAAHEILMGLEAKYPTWPVKPSLIGDIGGLILAVYGGLNFDAPYDLLAATIGGYVSMDLYRYLQGWIGGYVPQVRVATVAKVPVTAAQVSKVAYTTQNSVVVKPTSLMNQGRYVVRA